MSDDKINSIVKTLLKKEPSLANGHNQYLRCSKESLEVKLADIAKLMLINIYKEEIRQLELSKD